MAGDGKVARGAVRPDRAQVNLLSVMDTATGTTLTQREIPAKTNEIPELAPAIAHLDLSGKVVTLDALHTQAETARHLVEDKHAHYLLIVKGNQPTLHATIAGLLTGPDTDFPTDITDDRGHGRREQRTIRTATATGTNFPPAGQVFRIRRDRGELHGPWTSQEIVYGITDLGPDQAGPTQIGIYTRQHWGIENRTHYIRDVTFGEDASQVRNANLPHALTTIRNLVLQHIPPHRTCQHRPHTQTPLPRPPPNPRSLRTQTSRHSIGQITNSPGPWGWHSRREDGRMGKARLGVFFTCVAACALSLSACGGGSEQARPPVVGSPRPTGTTKTPTFSMRSPAAVKETDVCFAQERSHPGSGRVGGSAQDADPAGAVLDHRQHVHARPG